MPHFDLVVDIAVVLFEHRREPTWARHILRVYLLHMEVFVDRRRRGTCVGSWHLRLAVFLLGVARIVWILDFLLVDRGRSLCLKRSNKDRNGVKRSYGHGDMIVMML